MLSSLKMRERTRNLWWNELQFIVGKSVAIHPARRFCCGLSSSARNIGSDPDKPIYLLFLMLVMLTCLTNEQSESNELPSHQLCLFHGWEKENLNNIKNSNILYKLEKS